MSFDFRESIALFGGAFNPPHLGHTQAIRGLFRNPGVKKVMVLPSFGTPLKNVGVSFEQRMEMCKLAFGSEPGVEINDIEKQHETQFTWQVLEKLKASIPNAAFVIGTDQFLKLDQWAKYPEIVGMCDWIVLLRRPHSMATLNPLLEKMLREKTLGKTDSASEFFAMGKKMKFVETDAADVSSTRIRERLASGDATAAKEGLSPVVMDCILRNRIYG